MRRENKIDLFEVESQISKMLKEMDVKIVKIRATIKEGKKLHDRLMNSEPNTCDYDKVLNWKANIHSFVADAKLYYTKSKNALEDLAFKIQLELDGFQINTKEDSERYRDLKRLRAKITDTKQTLKGYPINALENTAFETHCLVEKISEQHFNRVVK